MPRPQEGGKGGPAARAHPQVAPAPQPPQRPPRQPRPAKTTKPARKQTNHKKSNPNADHAFNHRSHFTKFKRRIHAQRRWVLEGHTNSRSHPLSPQEGQAAVPSVCSSSSVSEHDATEEMPVEDPSWTPGTSRSPGNTAAAVMRAVESMDALFLQLDAAMKRRRFGRAACLQRCIRARRHRLLRELQSKQCITAAKAEPEDKGGANSNKRAVTVDAVSTTTTAAAATASVGTSSTYRSFHPSSTWLGVGRHPRSDWVDQRSGRYPKTCSPECIKFILRNFGEETPLNRLSVPEDYAYLLPAPPPASAAKVVEGSSRTSNSTTVFPLPTPALTRAQRQQKASLYVASYCSNILTDALDDICFTLLQGLYKEQRDLKQKQPLQFKARHRYVAGFQEVLKCLKAGRVKLVLLAADVESVDVSEAELEDVHTPPPTAAAAPAHTTTKSTRKKAFQSLYEAISQVQQLCATAKPSQTAPASSSVLAVNSTVRPSTHAPPLCITCMSRQRLSYALYAKSSKIACVGVMQAEKNRDAFKAVMAYGRLLTRVYANEAVDGTLAAECDV